LHPPNPELETSNSEPLRVRTANGDRLRTANGEP
jgi:hypothetical protein